MTNELIERLKFTASELSGLRIFEGGKQCAEAAAEIERLRECLQEAYSWTYDDMVRSGSKFPVEIYHERRSKIRAALKGQP
jgi:hypothetical protein